MVVLLCYVICIAHWLVSLYSGMTMLCVWHCTLVRVWYVHWHNSPIWRTLYTGTCQQYTSITPLVIDTTSGACLWFIGATTLCDSYGHYTQVCAFSIVVPLRYVRDTVHLYMSLVLWYYYGICDLYCTLVYVFSMVVQLCFVIDTVQYKCTGKTPLKFLLPTCG